MKNPMRYALVAVMTMAAAGCNRNRAEIDVDPNVATILIVDNQSFPDMTIYAIEGGRRVRLGLAGGNTRTRFTLPKYLVRSLTMLRFQADPIGSARAPVSDEILVSPGDEVMLRIPP